MAWSLIPLTRGSQRVQEQDVGEKREQQIER